MSWGGFLNLYHKRLCRPRLVLSCIGGCRSDLGQACSQLLSARVLLRQEANLSAVFQPGPRVGARGLRSTLVLSQPCDFPSEAQCWCYSRYPTCRVGKSFEPIRQNEARAEMPQYFLLA